jgi:alkylhydroperoxidase family enzyme
MARMPYIDPEQVHWLARDMMLRRPGRNLHRMLAHTPRVGDAFTRLADALRHEGELDPELRELVMLRVGNRLKSEYEVRAHTRIAKGVGVPDDKIAGLAGDIAAGPYTEVERRVLRFTDDLIENVRASDATFDPVADCLTKAELVELVITIGTYLTACRILETFDIDMQ